MSEINSFVHALVCTPMWDALGHPTLPPAATPHHALKAGASHQLCQPSADVSDALGHQRYMHLELIDCSLCHVWRGIHLPPEQTPTRQLSNFRWPGRGSHRGLVLLEMLRSIPDTYTGWAGMTQAYGRLLVLKQTLETDWPKTTL